MMRALTLTQPWCGLVASGLKLVENRPRPMIKAEDFGKPFGLHASREIDESVYERVAEIAPDLLSIAQNIDGGRDRFYVDTNKWHTLSRITGAIVAVATIKTAIYIGGCSPQTIFEALVREGVEDQFRFTFGPTVYILDGAPTVLPRPVPCRGWQGFWRMSDEIEAKVRAQLTPIGELIDRSSIGAGLRDIKERGIDAHTEDLIRELDELPVEFGGNRR